MITKPFRSPLLRNSENSMDIDRVSEPSAKKRRISSDNVNDVETIGPRLVFKTHGISSAPRKPLLAVRNPAAATELLDGGLDGYYNVLWYIHLQNERSDHRLILCTGGSLRPRSIKPGTVMVFYESLAATPISKTC